jgi:hypothetical protein
MMNDGHRIVDVNVLVNDLIDLNRIDVDIGDIDAVGP